MVPTHQQRAKRVLLIDAVVWSAGYPARHPLRDVGRWFARHLADDSGVALEVLSAEKDVLRALRRGADGVILSGSPRDAWAADPSNDKLCALVEECQRRSVPFLGVGYGHQLLARALGGVVTPHPAGLELGNFPVQLTSAGKRSPLFNGFPAEFEVLLSHADAVLKLPPSCELLATGRHTAIQALACEGRLFGVQFHPETDPEILRFLWSARLDRWRDKVSFDLERALDGLRPAPLAPRVLQNFVNHCIP
jgi:GMP synthase (glutamine-hydrolysing)